MNGGPLTQIIKETKTKTMNRKQYVDEPRPRGAIYRKECRCQLCYANVMQGVGNSQITVADVREHGGFTSVLVTDDQFRDKLL